jgi:hypothetical protein
MRWDHFSVNIMNKDLDQLVSDCGRYYVDGSEVSVDFHGDEEDGVEYKHKFDGDAEEGEYDTRTVIKTGVENDFKNDKNLGWANCFHVVDVKKYPILDGVVESNQWLHMKDRYQVVLKYGYYTFADNKSEKKKKRK